jgi:hypothetical protein
MIGAVFTIGFITVQKIYKLLSTYFFQLQKVSSDPNLAAGFSLV